MGIDPGLKSAYRDWTQAPERGNPRSLVLGVRFARSLSRRWATLLLYPIAAYFAVFSPHQRAASRQFLARALGRSPRQRDIYAHYLTFARMLLDRVYWLARDDPAIPVQILGAAKIEAMLATSPRGLIILGAHLGSFEALRGACDHLCGRRIRPVMYVENARNVQPALDTLNPTLARDVILAGRPGAMLEIRDAIEQGDIVGILADRSPSGDRAMQVPFLGAAAPFPVGPHRLAAVLGVPAVFACAVLDGRGYAIHFEPLSQPAPMATPAGADHTCEAHVREFVGCLERHARAHPFNWFNFYDFWNSDTPSPPDWSVR